MTLLLTLRGTPFMYYGEEIGMRDISLSRSEIMDPPGKKYWPIYKGRDGCRSPMQWSNARYAGFSTFQPWLKVHPNYVLRNVSAQQEDPNSLLNFTQRLIALRRRHAALRDGSFNKILQQDKNILAYERTQVDECVQIYINFSGDSRQGQFSRDADDQSAVILLDNGNRKGLSVRNNQFVLAPHEILVLRVKSLAIRD